jgi:hypothetical protein
MTKRISNSKEPAGAQQNALAKALAYLGARNAEIDDPYSLSLFGSCGAPIAVTRLSRERSLSGVVTRSQRMKRPEPKLESGIE